MINQFEHTEPLALTLWLFLYDSSALLALMLIVYLPLKLIYLEIKWTFF